MAHVPGAALWLMSEYGNAESVLTVFRITRTTDSIAPLFSVPSFTFGQSMGKVLVLSFF